jgi:hypothetical protein
LIPATPALPQLVEIQKSQASELIQSAPIAGLPVGSAGLPVVYAGDFNGFAAATYDILVNPERVDAWKSKFPMQLCSEGQAGAGDLGCTCCQDPKLDNPMSKLSHRIDLVIVPNNTQIEHYLSGLPFTHQRYAPALNSRQSARRTSAMPSFPSQSDISLVAGALTTKAHQAAP